MVLVGVAAHHRLELFHPLLLQVGDHQLAVGHVATVDEQIFPAAFQQRAVRLPHVHKVDRQGIAGKVVGGRRGGRSGAAAQQRQRQKQKKQPFFHRSFVSP